MSHFSAFFSETIFEDEKGKKGTGCGSILESSINLFYSSSVSGAYVYTQEVFGFKIIMP